MNSIFVQMVIREGEQHELAQFTSDLLSYYKMYSQQSVNILANEIYKRCVLYESFLRNLTLLYHIELTD